MDSATRLMRVHAQKALGHFHQACRHCASHQLVSCTCRHGIVETGNAAATGSVSGSMHRAIHHLSGKEEPSAGNQSQQESCSATSRPHWMACVWTDESIRRRECSALCCQPNCCARHAEQVTWDVQPSLSLTCAPMVCRCTRLETMKMELDPRADLVQADEHTVFWVHDLCGGQQQIT